MHENASRPAEIVAVEALPHLPFDQISHVVRAGQLARQTKLKDSQFFIRNFDRVSETHGNLLRKQDNGGWPHP